MSLLTDHHILVLFLLNFCFYQETYCILSPRSPLLADENRYSLTQCILEASGKFLKDVDTITYSLPISDPPTTTLALSTILLSGLMKKWTVVVKNISRKEYITINYVMFKPKSYIIQIRNDDEFEENIQRLKMFSNWNPQAKFLVVAATVFENPLRVAQRLLKNLFDADVVNAVVLLSDPDQHKSFTAYTWYPYKDGNCGHDVSKVLIIDYCHNGTATSDNNLEWFGKRVPKKFNKCLIKVKVVEWPPFVMVENATYGTSDNYFETYGIEIDLLNLLAEIFNVTMFYFKSEIPLNWGDIGENFTLSGNIKSLHDSEHDMAIGSYSTTYQRSLLFDTPIYMQETIHWCVPYIPVDTKLKRMMEIISFNSYLATILIVVVLTVFMSQTSSKRELNSYKNLYNCSQNTYRIFLGLPVFRQPTTDAVRYFMALLMLYSFYVLSAYQTLMTSVLSKNKYVQTYASIYDIVNDDLNLFGISGSLRYFDGNDALYQNLLEKIEICDGDISKCLDRVAFDQDSAIVLPKLYSDYVVKGLLDDDNTPLMYCFKKPIVSYPVNILIRKGFPLTEHINGMIIRIKTNGIILKWQRDIFGLYLKNISNNIQRSTVKDKSKRYKTSLNRLNFVFILWLIGCSLSALEFFVELMYYKFINGYAKK